MSHFVTDFASSFPPMPPTCYETLVFSGYIQYATGTGPQASHDFSVTSTFRELNKVKSDHFDLLI